MSKGEVKSKILQEQVTESRITKILKATGDLFVIIDESGVFSIIEILASFKINLKHKKKLHNQFTFADIFTANNNLVISFNDGTIETLKLTDKRIDKTIIHEDFGRYRRRVITKSIHSKNNTFVAICGRNVTKITTDHKNDKIETHSKQLIEDYSLFADIISVGHNMYMAGSIFGLFKFSLDKENTVKEIYKQ